MVPSDTLARKALARSVMPWVSTGSTGVMSAFCTDSQALPKPFILPCKLSCMTLAAAAALPSALRSFSARASTEPMP